MFDILTVQSALSGLIGWRDSENTELPALTAALKATSSGLYFNDAHPLVTIENIDAAGPNYDGVANATWAVGTTYGLSAVVRYNGVTYISLAAANTGNTPSTATAWWKAQLNNYISQLTNTAIINMVQRVINDKQLVGASKALLDDIKLFDGDGRSSSLIVAQSRFVGFEIKVKNYEGLIASIGRIGAQFTEAQAGLILYLFHSSQQTAVATYTMVTTAANSMQWLTPTGFDMNFCKFSKNDAGGAWYIGYFEDSMTGQAINRDIDMISSPCGTCLKDAYNYFSWEMRNRFFQMQPVEFENKWLNGTSLPDMDGVAYVSSKNWGLNLSITAHCDLTDFFVDNKAKFTRALWKQLAYDVIRQIAFSTRMDGITQTLRSDAYIELKGDPTRPYKSGLEHELTKEYEALNISVADLNSPCMGKRNKGIKVGGI
jgi:hypothetical protein